MPAMHVRVERGRSAFSVSDAVVSHSASVVSTFAGAGGSSLGYRLAGYKVLWASEFVDAAADCYAANMAEHTTLDRRDIRDVDAQDILRAIDKDVGELDVLDGSPPCSPFSSVGARAHNWGKVKRYSGDVSQRSDDLFGEYTRLVAGLRPRYFVAENVVGLSRGMSKGYLRATINELREIGYDVQSRVLDAQYLGVPQRRRRLILLGTRSDVRVRARYPEPQSQRVAVQDALPYLSLTEGRDVAAAAMGYVRVLDASVRPTSRQSYIHTPNYRDERNAQRTDEPSVTITASGARDVTRERVVVSSDASVVLCAETQHELTHVAPLVRRTYPNVGVRMLSIPEVRVLCSYPQDYVLVGSYAQRWERLGRSVPPLMMYAVASALAEAVLA